MAEKQVSITFSYKGDLLTKTKEVKTQMEGLTKVTNTYVDGALKSSRATNVLSDTFSSLMKRLVITKFLYVEVFSRIFNAAQDFIGGSVEEFKKFETSVAKLSNTLSDQARVYLPEITRQIRELSLATGESADKLTDAYTTIIKSGYGVVSSMNILREATKLAVAEGADLKSTTELLTLSMKQWNISGLEVAKMTEKLNVLLENTVFNIEDLRGDMVTLAPLAKQMGMNFDEFAATLMTLNVAGIENITRAFTNLANTFITPSEQMIDIMAEWNIAFDPIILQGEGLVSILKAVKTEVGYNVAELGKLIGNANAFAVVMAISNGDFETYNNNLKLVKTTVGDLDKDFNRIMGTFEQKTKLFGTAIQDIQRGIGGGLTSLLSEFEITTTKEIVDLVKQKMGTEDWNKVIEELKNVAMPTENVGMFEVGLGGTAADVQDDFETMIQSSETFRKTYIDMVADIQVQPLKEYFNNLKNIVQTQGYSYQFAVAQLDNYRIELKDLMDTQKKMPEMREYSLSLKYVSYALKNAAYDTYIWNENNKYLDKSLLTTIQQIRAYNEQIKALEKTNYSYNKEIKENSIEAMEIQLMGMARRRGNTRSEERMLKQLRIEDMKNQIEIAKNQQNIDDIRENGVNVLQDQLDTSLMAYNSHFDRLNDTYQRDYDNINKQIENKELLIDYYTNTFIPGEYDKLVSYTNLLTDQLDKIPQSKFTDVAQQKWLDYEKTVRSVCVNVLKMANASSVKSLGEIPSTTVTATTTADFSKWAEGTRGKRWGGGRQYGSYSIPQNDWYFLHKYEKVVPAGKETNGGGNIINISVNVDHLNNDIDIEKLAARLGRATQASLIRSDGRTKYGIR